MDRTVREDVLDNLAWHALTGPQADLAEGDGVARRYHPSVSPFTAVDRLDEAAWAALARLAGPGGSVLLGRPTLPEPPPGWRTDLRLQGHQMVLADAVAVAVAGGADGDPAIRPLTDDDVPAMLDLTELTKPGPFLAGTIRFGGYVGVDDEHGRLVAMAGRRMAAPGYVEISAVCVHPDAAGRGLASAVTSHVARAIQDEGATPLLHVATGNDRARRVYERLGFATRVTGDFAVFAPPA